MIAAELRVRLGGSHFPGSVFLYSSAQQIILISVLLNVVHCRVSIIWYMKYKSLQSKALKPATRRNVTVKSRPAIQIHVLTQSHFTCICAGEVCKM